MVYRVYARSSAGANLTTLESVDAAFASLAEVVDRFDVLVV